MGDKQIKRAITYGFLAQTRNSAIMHNGPLEVFVPLIKKGMSRYCIITKRKGGESIKEIADIIEEEYAIEFPISVLRELLKRIEREINDRKLFCLHNDDSFLLKSYMFLDFEEEIQLVGQEVKLIQDIYEQFCVVYEYDTNKCPSVIDFIDHNRMALSSYISGKSKNKEIDYTVAAQFVDFCKKIPAIYQLLCNLYLGSVITCYLEFKPQEARMDVDLLLDTNFIISLLDLNTEESTKTCKKLMEITKSIGYTYHVLKDTIEETQSLLHFKSRIFNTDVIYKFINKEDVISACERLGYNDSDLDRIADNLEDTLLNMGIQIVYNTNHLDGKAKYSPEYSILKSKRNTPKAALHDAKAIYYVKDKRGKKIDTFEESNCWFVNNSITHDNDRDSIETLLSEDKKGGMPEIIRADDLLNILWLSNPQIDVEMANSELSDIGLTSLVSLTLNKSLPKARVIRDLDDNIQKYRTEDVTDRDVLMLSTRIINHQLNSDAVEQMNKNASKDRKEFSRRIKEEAQKEEAVQKERNDKINKIVTTWQINLKDLLKGKLSIKKTEEDARKALEKENKEKDEEIRRLKEEQRQRENEIRKEKRDAYIANCVKKWRKWPRIMMAIFVVLLLLGIAWLVYSFLFVKVDTGNKECMLLESKLFSLLFTIIISIINVFVIKAFYDREFLTTNINAFINSIEIPAELKEIPPKE